MVRTKSSGRMSLMRPGCPFLPTKRTTGYSIAGGFSLSSIVSRCRQNTPPPGFRRASHSGDMSAFSGGGSVGSGGGGER